MKLLTKELEEVLPKLYATENVRTDNKIMFVKFFTPDANWTWYACEYSKEDRLFFGYVIGAYCEWGYFSLDELESIKGPLGLNIERDISFKPTKFKDIYMK